jgi:K+-transporting ATPase ATPase C chain
VDHGQVVGSRLIGQNFNKDLYFHPRPSAAAYDAQASGGTNDGPTSQKLIHRVEELAQKFRRENPDFSGPIPADLITTSFSGLDPHISPASAEAQAPRVARARRIPLAQLRSLIARRVEGRDLGFLGESRVNVLLLNRTLDQDFPLSDRKGNR